jgi:hypothetical protein
MTSLASRIEMAQSRDESSAPEEIYPLELSQSNE